MAWKPTCGCLPWHGVPGGGFAQPGGGFAGGFAGGFTSPVTPHLLLDLDFRFPIVQPFPQTAAEMTALGLPAPTHIWDFEEAAGNVLDHIGAIDLIPVNAPLQSQDAVGIGAIPYPVKSAGEVYITNHSFDSNDAALLQADGVTSWALLCVVRVPSHVIQRYLASKRDAVAPNVGWDLDWQGVSLTFRLDEGVAQQTSIIVADLDDGAWHALLIVADANAGTIQLFLDGQAGGAALYNPAVSAATFHTGYRPAVNDSLLSQFAYMATWEGVNAEGMGLADLTNFWVHGTDPTGLLTTATHASLLSDIVGEDTGGLGTLLGEFSTIANRDQLPITYNAGLSGPTSLGLRCQPARTTHITDSDDFTVAAWVVNNAAVSAIAADLNNSPRGMREANRLTATAANGYVQDLFVSVAATVYTFDFFVKRHSTMGANVAGALQMWDNTGAAIIATQAFVATTEWQRVVLRATSVAGQISTGFRIRIDTNGEALSIFRATAVTGELTVPIFAAGGVATVALTDHRALVAYRTLRGEVEVTYICNADLDSGAVRAIWNLLGLIGNNNRRLNQIAVNERNQYQVYDAVGVIHSNYQGAIRPHATETLQRILWRMDIPIDGTTYFRQLNNGVAVDGIAGPGSAAEPGALLHIGQFGAASILDGQIPRLRIWDDVTGP